MTQQKSAYALSGVDIAAGERAVELMKSSVRKAQRPESIGGLGGFAGLFDANALKSYEHPGLATSTDGVGTKVAVAQQADRHDTIGIDLVAMLVDDLVVCGAEPLFVTDYIACGAVVPERIAQIVSGISEGCQQAGAALIGGETAEHPGLLSPEEYDLAGATTGVVEKSKIIDGSAIQPGDAIIAMRSSGLHSNGYSLVRNVLLAKGGYRLESEIPELQSPLVDELLIPTKIYAKPCLGLIQTVSVHGMSHITGGGLANNLARIIPKNLTATIDRSTWEMPVIMRLVQEIGTISLADLEATLNLGVGMVAVVPAHQVGAAVDYLQQHDVDSWQCGVIDNFAGDSVQLSGSYA